MSGFWFKTILFLAKIGYMKEKRLSSKISKICIFSEFITEFEGFWMNLVNFRLNLLDLMCDLNKTIWKFQRGSLEEIDCEKNTFLGKKITIIFIIKMI